MTDPGFADLLGLDDDEDDEVEPVEGQAAMFDDAEVHIAWQQWRGMPEFRQDDLTPWRSVLVHFRNAEDWRAFHELLGQRPGMGPGQSLWYPAAEIGTMADKRFVSDRP